MKRFLLMKADGFYRRLSARLRRDYELAEYARSHIQPLPPSQPDLVRNAPQTMLGACGIELDVDSQLDQIASWNSDRYQELLRELRGDPAIAISTNGFFMAPDAEIYASMILERNPDRIVEVGSGFSTLRRTGNGK